MEMKTIHLNLIWSLLIHPRVITDWIQIHLEKNKTKTNSNFFVHSIKAKVVQVNYNIRDCWFSLNGQKKKDKNVVYLFMFHKSKVALILEQHEDE